MIILDAAKDWRFAKNVCRSCFISVLELNINFYVAVGSWASICQVLRRRAFTDARWLQYRDVRSHTLPLLFAKFPYNVKIRLAVLDDQPRDVFSPRQRHTLKEFAAVAMREMELWRDKVHALLTWLYALRI